nr:PREDICTED: transmembrane protein 160 [Latimeria chalumnae]|eukprot:XP_014343895.1 PREDICTED: transmembrane protein 160 [Latimeria chalumnae]
MTLCDADAPVQPGPDYQLVPHRPPNSITGRDDLWSATDPGPRTSSAFSCCSKLTQPVFSPSAIFVRRKAGYHGTGDDRSTPAAVVKCVGQTTHGGFPKADAWMVRKAHETGFLSWFRNGLVATGIGVISYAQSDVGQEAAFGFFVLGGICVSYGSASYLANLVLLRRTMMLSFPVVFMNGLAVASVAVFWLCAISLYIGRLKVEVVYDEEECDECKAKKNDGKSDK